ncbi:hypothetical protein BS50DRAFT_628992 [Corynespora cassiicola Philippines]|uniref:C6 transcription factor n=1 Tax=Corynespora cassiicola Philippines TaxID=1448308 RepID=A0A2T2P5B9_CORCC|nr:hypothetical protein BS50DRAFT_628992 [Corynespora cassiicola Philippines]
MALATARTLCQVQILRGEKTWRTHLDGARAIIQSAHPQEKATTEKMQIYEKSFLSSWYNNAEALAALTPSGLLRGQLEADGVTNPSMSYFDVFGGVASDIPSLLREIGALVEERRRSKSKRRSYESLLSERDIIKEAEALMVQIYHRLEEDATGGLFFDSHLLSVLSPDDIQDYSMSNASFLHTALLYLQCGVLRLPSSDPGVQGSVYGIITCAESMTPSLGSSPRVLLGTPLFTAGLCATGPARERIRSAFEDIGKWLRTPHVSKAIRILEDLWSRFIDESKGDVWSYIEKTNPDFLAY